MKFKQRILRDFDARSVMLFSALVLTASGNFPNSATTTQDARARTSSTLSRAGNVEALVSPRSRQPAPKP